MPPVSVDCQWDTEQQVHSRLTTGGRNTPPASLPGAKRGLQRDQLELEPSLEDTDSIYPNSDPNPPSNGAAGGADAIPQMTALVTMISSFLCPSDGARRLGAVLRWRRQQARGDMQLSRQHRSQPAHHGRSGLTKAEAERAELRRQLGWRRQRDGYHVDFPGRDEQHGDVQRMDQGASDALTRQGRAGDGLFPARSGQRILAGSNCTDH